MTEMLYKVILSTLLGLTYVSGAFSQSSPLTITGTVTEVRVQPGLVPVIDEKNPWGDLRFERQGGMEPWFNVSIHLQYCNRGEIALIVPVPLSLTNKMIFLELPSADSKGVMAVSPAHSYTGFDTMPAFITELERLEPLKLSFATIEPSTCYGANVTLAVKSGFKVKEVSVIEKRRAPISIAIPEYPYFRLQFSRSMKDSLPVSEAKQRWKHFGKLLTTSDGDFFFESDYIVNKLPE